MRRRRRKSRGRGEVGGWREDNGGDRCRRHGGVEGGGVEGGDGAGEGEEKAKELVDLDEDLKVVERVKEVASK